MQAVPEVFEAFGDFYAKLAPDVLCLQEVHCDDLIKDLAQRLGMTAWLRAPGGQRQDYGGAILTRRPATLRDCTHLPGQPPAERVHLRASFPELEIAMVHLPSDRFAADPEAACVAELQRVLATSPRPGIVLGDFNSRPGSAPYRFMLEAGYFDVGKLDEQHRRIDYIWLDAIQAARLTNFATLETSRTTPTGEPWQLSDHPPLLAELR
ncbi:MAG: hypothetical protein PCFJNLEI_02084 [Verrucomicrobiae bacterium]|nr:hypothetical protein [Verrucomicrobiae bacterium]